MTFNLIDEPWLRCVARDGELVELGLGELFHCAHELSDLAHPGPGQRIALLRLLVAVHQAALRGPTRTEKLAELLDRGRIDDCVPSYLEQWRPRFELFESDRPFFQPSVDETVTPTTVATLIPDWSSGNNAMLADHHRDDRPPTLTPAEAARAVVVAQAFQLGGGVSKPFNRKAAPLVGGLVGLLAGSNLLETILVNSVRYDPNRGLPVPSHDVDLPCWERDEERKPDRDGTAPNGWLDLLTWQPRAIRLLPDGAGAIRECVIHQHLALPPGTHDPHIPMREKDGELVRVRPAEGRGLWRQADAILLGLCRVASDRAGGVLADLEELLDRDAIAGIDVAGLVTRQANVSDWSSVRFPVGSRIANSPEVGEWIRLALDRARRTAGAIAFAIRNDNRGEALSNHWEELYWGELRRPFDANLRELLLDAGDPSSIDKRWDAVLRAAAHRAVDVAVSVQVATPSGYRREAVARRKLQIRLAKIVPIEKREVEATA